jgi:hypothetical protein
MKNIKALISIVSSAAVLALVMGCATAKRNEMEGLLSAAGFKMVPATTAAQQAHLKSLPPGKITSAQRDGEMYFTYPDAVNKVLYVGQQAEYKSYQNLRVQKEMADEKLDAAQMNESAYTVWGGWGGGRWR